MKLDILAEKEALKKLVKIIEIKVVLNVFRRNNRKYSFNPKIIIKCVDKDYNVIEFATEQPIVHRRQEIVMQTIKEEGLFTIKESIKNLEKKYRYVEVTELIK